MFNFNTIYKKNKYSNVNYSIHKNKYSKISSTTGKQIEDIISTAKKIIEEHLLPIIKSTGEKLEGNIFMEHHTTTYTNKFIDKQINLILSVLNNNIKDVMEIGFNAGFSTLLLLLANNNIKITCVDICMHNYTKLCFFKLKEIFGDRINLISGSSVDIVPTLKGNIYDIIHIDGCHLVDIAEQDIKNSLCLCKSGTILIMDDTDDVNLLNVWKKYVNTYNLISSDKFIVNNYHDIKIYT